MDVRLPRERGFGIARHRDELRALALEDRNNRQQLVAGAGIGERDEDVIARHHAEIPMTCFSGVDEKRRGAGAGEGRRHLARDVAGLAHAAYHDAAAALHEYVHSPREMLVELVDEIGNGPGLDLQYFARQGKRCTLLGRATGVAGCRLHCPESIAESAPFPSFAPCNSGANRHHSTMHSTLQSVLILLATAVAVVVVFRSLRLPPMLGYLIVGVAIGPNALGWIADTEQAHELAEIGVVFLMFSIGLEFSLAKLVTMRRIVLGLGSAQVLLSMLVVWGIAIALGADWKAGMVLGGVLAMSSTAILARLLAERLELNSPHGRQIIGVLLFQDIAVVPLLILLPALSAGTETLVVNLGWAFAKAALILTLMLYLGHRLMRSWFHLVARQKSSELFILNVLLITLGLAYVTELAGLSLALGAFVAGTLIAETEYRYQVEVDI